ncbi:PT repeat [Promicromonospora thailandica]|uniref:PT repeat n=2 Tax=Promicromonospora thailandica TaxID=765201 RepID=A0A9X2G394_9MICO|nr:PT repeat [Promicromonospora thailandica]
MSDGGSGATMERMRTPSPRRVLRWAVGALAATVLATLAPVLPEPAPSGFVSGAPGPSTPPDPFVSGLFTTGRPTASPSASMSPSPSPAASGEPSGTPSAGPSVRPSPEPSDDPSGRPSEEPVRTSGTPITFPTSKSAGLPAGWTPKQTRTGDLWIRKNGTVVQDLRITNGVIHVAAKNVTLRRVHAVGSQVVNAGGDACGTGLLIESSTFVAGSGQTRDTDVPVVGDGGLTVRDVVIDGVPEGIRVGAKQCGDVVVESSFVRIVPPDVCDDWHGDGVQGYGGGTVTVRHTRIIMRETADCYGTAPFFYPSGQGNTALTVDGLLVEGGGYAFRAGTPGTVRNLQVVRDSWGYGPVDVACSALSHWQAHVVTVSSSTGRTTPAEEIRCTGVGN